MSLTQIQDHTKNRYHSLSLSSIWELDVIRKAQALVIGAGALGNEVAKNLTMMGVKSIVIVDRDTVEVANLSRSVFYRESDHGRSKVEVLAERLRELNGDVEIIPLNGDLDQVLGLGVVRRMDMIFSCLDNRLARRTLNRMCQKLAKPWVDGSMENLIGDVTAYYPDDGPCYECGLTQSDNEIIAQAVSCRGIVLQNLSLGKVPTTPTMGSIISALQVQEAIKILHHSGKPARLVVNCGINDFYNISGLRKDDCQGHYRYGEITEIPEWSGSNTSPRDILSRFEVDTGQEGHLRLGREIVIGLNCAKCGITQELVEPLRLLTLEKVLCDKCGEMREPKTTNVVRGSEIYTDWPLQKLGIPLFDIVEVLGAGGGKWYETTGDLGKFS